MNGYMTVQTDKWTDNWIGRQSILWAEEGTEDMKRRRVAHNGMEKHRLGLTLKKLLAQSEKDLMKTQNISSLKCHLYR